jgi:hypothetical protein
MQERGDLNHLVDIFKIWKQYMLIDLKEYESKNYEVSLCFDVDKKDFRRYPLIKNG